MRTKLKGLLMLVLAFAWQATFAQQKVTGTVTDAVTGEPLPGVNILIEGTQKGTVTDFDGKYSLTASPDDVLVFSYVGYGEVKEKVGNRSVINVKMVPGEELEAAVIDISGQKREVKTLSYAVQQVKAEQLEISDLANVGSAISGKVAGAQVLDQAGSKLGERPRIRIRGRIALSTDSDPLYVVDGVVVQDPSLVDPDDIASMEVLKGPNATAIYGQRGENGVVVITTKSAKKGKFGVDINSKITLEEIAYLPKYQNWYGQGRGGDSDWAQFGGPITFYNVFLGASITVPSVNVYPGWGGNEFQGAYFLTQSLYDESWGPKFDGRDYMPWYAWVPGSPYFGQKAKWEANPNNISNFFDTGVYLKNNIALYSATDKYSARIAFSNLDQKGVLPYSTFKRYGITSNFKYNVTDKLEIGLNTILSYYKTQGDFNDNYANQTTGSFNQWFARQVDMEKLKELIDLKTPEGYYASWNWWAPSYMSWLGGWDPMRKPVFWFNPYTWLRDYDRNSKGNIISNNLSVNYKFNEDLSLKISYSHYQTNRFEGFELPFVIEHSSAHNLFMTYVNSFGEQKSQYNEDNYNAFLFYKKDISDDLNLDLMVGTTLRDFNYNRTRVWMDYEDDNNGLIIPNVYRFDNTKKPVTPTLDKRRKKVYSLFGKTTFGYKNYLFLEATLRQDWSSALFPDNNGYIYPSTGLSIIFSELDAFSNFEDLSFGKFRIGWAQVGSDVREHLIYPRYPLLSGVPYQGYATLVTPSYIVDPNLKPALNSSFETGLDMKFYDNKLGFSLTYYYEKRKDEIIFQEITNATGYSSYLTNGGSSHRSGIELTVDAVPYQTEDFTWDINFNFAKNKTIVDEVPGDATEMVAPGGRWWSNGDTWSRIVLVHAEGQEWGQIKGYDIKRDNEGNPVLSGSGLYVPTDDQVYFGSVLPDFTGGFTNTFRYKDFALTAHFTFQKGGKFYSGSEVWGYYSGLYEETGLNGDRAAGVEVSGVDAVGGNSVSYNVPARSYFKQFHQNNIAGPFIHDASYFKLRELSLSYKLPKKYLGKYLKGATVSFIGTNVWLISVSKDNYHRWDPSELSQTYGEDGQLPGTRRYGMNIKLSF